MELLQMQSEDRRMFEAIRMERRKKIAVGRVSQYKEKITKFDSMCSRIRKQMRADHKQIKQNFYEHPCLDQQEKFSNDLNVINYGLDFFNH